MKKLLFFILCFVFIPMFINAENKIYFESEEINVSPGATYDINIKIDSDSDFTNVDFDVITTSTYIKLSNIEINGAFENTSNNGYSLRSTTPQKSGAVVATLSIKIDDKAAVGTTGLIRIINPKLTSDKKYNLDIDELNVNIIEQVKSNYLTSLSSVIAPFEFNKDKLEYEVEVEDDVKEFDLVATSEDSNATVSISNQKLDKRKNIINVKVSRDTLEDRVYKVVVIKKANEDNSTKIVRDNKDNKNVLARIKGEWIIIIICLSCVLVVDLFFLKRNK